MYSIVESFYGFLKIKTTGFRNGDTAHMTGTMSLIWERLLFIQEISELVNEIILHIEEEVNG